MKKEERKIRQEIEFWDMVEILRNWFESFSREYVKKKKKKAYRKLIALQFKKK